MRIQLSDHFTYGRLLRFTLPSIIMMVFTSVYSMVDGFFISNYVGKTAFAAINLQWPLFTIAGSVGMMLGTGGTAMIGKTLGEGQREKANEYFSQLVYVTLLLGALVAAVGWLAIAPLSRLLGAEGQMLEDCILYSRVLIPAMPFFMIQYSVQSFFIAAEKPKLGLFVTVFGGVANIVLDALMIVVFRWGLFGAAFATAMSQALAAVLALAYFSGRNSSLLQLTLKLRFRPKMLLRVCANGSSEMVGNIAYSVVTMLYNFQLMKHYGENGVAAYGVLMYVSFIFSAIYYGYAMGCAPVVSYHFGAKDRGELKNLFRKSMVLTGLAGAVMVVSAKMLAPVLSAVFVGYDGRLYALTHHAMQIYSFSFLIMGYGVYGSAFFTALNDGAVSAAISFLRTFVFETGSILLLPKLLGPDGIWAAVVVAELAAAMLSGAFFVSRRKKYGYM